MDDVKLLSCFKVLSREAKDLYVRRDVPVVECPISPLEFYRDWVSPNLPVVIKGAVKHWPAIVKWTNAYLRHTIGEKIVQVAATPNGFADAIADGYFVMPEERQMAVKDFLSVMEDPDSLPGTVLYVQSQNGNLGGDWAALVKDIELGLPWATEAFGEAPSAANFWMGDKRAVTSMHRDPFENIYCVIRGHKDFILHPPTDLPWLPYATLPAARYQSTKGSLTEPEFKIVPLATDCESRTEIFKNASEMPEKYSENVLGCDKISKLSVADHEQVPGTNLDEDSLQCEPVGDVGTSLVPWICIDPDKPNFKLYPMYRNGTQVKVRVHEGDVLFLPAHWFHHVKQSHSCIAVNFWYDVRYDHRYAYQAFITSLLQNSSLNTGCPPLC
ncbi:bifunctional peptidase and (3S)-lysyl hydroxylase Jmjd7-like [Ischnura elegans]|uniref:bifunctional peptidase and (3S)-lysyl hydroxylase Jmjd7-like n=1 Tax=Ischnura elegans TaxID=197161 RepID=UPI001ED8A399|nr:bifunctional peptidase and (3S)-lysyl hydroxylase Jmjd7-like [Ischnura elegans]